MRITVDASLTGRGEVDLDVTRGAALSEVVAEFPSRAVWCGSRLLDPAHRAGTPPLVSGAVLSAAPRRDLVDPASLHLAATAGPDAGVLIPLDCSTSVGAALPAAVLRDASCDALHATFSPMPRGAVSVRDEGSVNGTGVWVLRAGSLRWQGRRRSATLRSGDVITVGRTILEVRGGSPASDGDSRWRLAAASLRRAGVVRRLALPAIPPWRVGPTLELDGWPDPTRVGGGSAQWAAPIAIHGPRADEVARAVVLARGRRPPEPCPLRESWLSWLPDPLPSDGAIGFGASAADAGVEGGVFLTVDADGMTRRQRGVTTRGPVVRVREDTAQALVRSLAGSLPEPPPRTIGWAHAASLAGQFAPEPSSNPRSRAVVVGVRVEDQDLPWLLEMGNRSPITLIAGATGSGKTTLLATIAGGLAVSHPPHEFGIVILCAGDPGPLEPYLRLPQVRAFGTRVSPADALSLLDGLYGHERFTVVIADDLDRLGHDGRAVAARLESIALQGDGSDVHVIMATGRPAAVFTPSLRAATGTAVALRAERPADSVEVIGVEAAANVPRHLPGRALVRSGGRIDSVQVALPWADEVRVRPWEGPAQGVRSLAEAARAAPAATAPSPPAWRDPTPPAS